MLKIHDEAIILTTRKHAETSALVVALTQNHGVYHGMVRGSQSKQNRGLYHAGNKLAIEWSARIPEHLGSIKGEMSKANAAHIMQNATATAALNSACSLLASSLPERHAYPNLYVALDHLIASFNLPNNGWLWNYVEFEMLLLAETGFGLDLSECAATGQTHDLVYVSPKSGRAVSREAGEPYKDKMLRLPAQLLCHPCVGRDPHHATDKKENVDASLRWHDREIQVALTLTGFFLEHRLFENLHKKLPIARARLLETLANCAI